MEKFDSNYDYVTDFAERWNGQLRQTRIWMGVLAAVLIAIGVFSLFAPYGMYAFIQIAVATALLVHGASQIVAYVGTPEFFRSSTLLAGGVLNALLGVVLFILPASVTASAMVFMLGFLFIMSGIDRISFSRKMRYFDLPGTGTSLALGILNTGVGVAFLLMPLFSSVVLSYTLAAYLIVGGITLLIEALSMKRIELS